MGSSWTFGTLAGSGRSGRTGRTTTKIQTGSCTWWTAQTTCVWRSVPKSSFRCCRKRRSRMYQCSFSPTNRISSSHSTQTRSWTPSSWWTLATAPGISKRAVLSQRKVSQMVWSGLSRQSPKNKRLASESHPHYKIFSSSVGLGSQNKFNWKCKRSYGIIITDLGESKELPNQSLVIGNLYFDCN